MSLYLETLLQKPRSLANLLENLVVEVVILKDISDLEHTNLELNMQTNEYTPRTKLVVLGRAELKKSEFKNDVPSIPLLSSVHSEVKSEEVKKVEKVEKVELKVETAPEDEVETKDEEVTTITTNHEKVLERELRKLESLNENLRALITSKFTGLVIVDMYAGSIGRAPRTYSLDKIKLSV